MNRDISQLNEEDILSFLLIGQSNMAGRGYMDEVEPIINQRCLMERNGRWQFMSEPINPDRPIFYGAYRSGVGLAASFADELSRHIRARVGLIPCADGGTALYQWMPGEVLFDNCVMKTLLAMRSSHFGGILWHQGENDVGHDDRVEKHKEMLVTFINALRKELCAEDLPFLIGELHTYENDDGKSRENTAKLNEEFREIASTLPYCGFVSEKGLTIQSDGVHFDAKSYREFGLRYFKEYARIVEL